MIKSTYRMGEVSAIIVICPPATTQYPNVEEHSTNDNTRGTTIWGSGGSVSDGKSLLYDYITEEELWACTTCNACVQECPVNISPLSIIVDLRRAMVMEDSKVPPELAQMNSNIENNGAPWQFAQYDRLNWAQGME